MATRKEIVDHILSQLQGAGEVYARKMFGEYGLYHENKMVALIADDQLFLKPTEAGKAFLGEIEEAPPYPGAKNWYLIPEDNWDDARWLCELILITSPHVTPPKPKKSKIPKA
ncbi:MAG: TfoX/Sxy family protein [Candidatus Cloacimonadaceae bacterium]|nr:TfoX/Sxy family protein [Candidatus Cloacimonadaceae bacterium]